MLQQRVYSFCAAEEKGCAPQDFCHAFREAPCSTSAKTWRLPMQATPMVMETLSVSWRVNLLGCVGLEVLRRCKYLVNDIH